MGTPTKKQIAAGQRRSLRAMQAKLMDMSAVWEDVDQYHLNILEEAADKLGGIYDELGETQEGE
ncbi:MAG: hypothetical protein C0439_10385 [Pseudomonas sp.]|nr:hypothetical protein [Pseudomonas sp.]